MKYIRNMKVSTAEYLNLIDEYCLEKGGEKFTFSQFNESLEKRGIVLCNSFKNDSLIQGIFLSVLSKKYKVVKSYNVTSNNRIEMVLEVLERQIF